MLRSMMRLALGRPHAQAQRKGREFLQSRLQQPRKEAVEIINRPRQNYGVERPAMNSLLVNLGSAAAYRARLEAGNYVSLAELVTVPFAPSKCTVLVDVLEKIRVETADAKSFQKRPPLTVADIRRVLGSVSDKIDEAIRDYEMFSDERAQAAAAGALAELDTLQKYVDGKWFEENSSLVTCGIAPDVAWEILSYLQKCSSVAGLWRECVVNYGHMKDLSHVVNKLLPDECVRAIAACEKERVFEPALALFNSYVADFGVSNVVELSTLLVALARCVRNAKELDVVRSLFIDEGVAAVVPVSVELYTALIAGCSRAVTSENSSKMMTVALSLYRALKDNQLQPSAETYSELVAVAAACAEPTQAFALFTEARVASGVASFQPSMYANLLRSYAAARLFPDAMMTLSVLAEAGAPLNRAAFHNVLSSASTPREASDVVALMSGPKFNIQPTVATYGLMLVAESKLCQGINTLLGAYDLWAKVLVLAGQAAMHQQTDPGQWLVERELSAVEALEHCLLCTRVDVTPQTAKYVVPLVRVPQLATTVYLGNFHPQSPTKVPAGSYVAVLAADVLNDVENLFCPIARHFAAIVLPYSQVVLYRRTRVDGSDEWAKKRQARLQQFLEENRSRVHLMSLEEEVRHSADNARYGIGSRDLVGRAAAVAINLSRGLPADVAGVYASSGAEVFLISTKFARCGRFVVDNRTISHRAKYHNPLAKPNWSPVSSPCVEAGDASPVGISADAAEDLKDTRDDELDASTLMHLLEDSS